jgi:hypothetical protein
MTHADQKSWAKWAKTREMGERRYISIYGVLLWGLVTGVGWAIVMSAIQGWNRLPIYLPLALVGFPIGGIFFGKTMWKKMEAKYHEALQKQTGSD